MKSEILCGVNFNLNFNEGTLMADMPLPQDQRSFWMLPQGPEDGGYYTFGTPENGAGQYCHPNLLNMILLVGFKWPTLDERKFGVGNISLANAEKFKDHDSHRNGLQVDIRPLRKDGQKSAVYCQDRNYDREGTAKLIKCFFDTGMVKNIYFNDASVPRVKYLLKHDNHFHIDAR